MIEVYKMIARVAPTGTTVLIHGESGSGKELVARAIHANSERRKFPFSVNCGALAESLLESELFGHVRGAFTGASYMKQGLFESANTTGILTEAEFTEHLQQGKNMSAVFPHDLVPLEEIERQSILHVVQPM